MKKPIATELLARKAFFGQSQNYHPYVSDGDSARVLFYMNLSGAYDGFAGMEQAMVDAVLFSRAPGLLAACKYALEFTGSNRSKKELAIIGKRLANEIAKAEGRA